MHTVWHNEIEEQRYGRNKDTIVNHSYINSGEYRRKFDNISDSAPLNRLLYGIAKDILFHRSGTCYEDMYWIDADTVSIVAKITDSVEAGGIKYNNSIKRVVETHKGLITIHSHPHSAVPSYNDLFCNYYYEYSLGIVVCHNGTVYLYSADEYIPETYYMLATGNFVKEGYPEDEAYDMVLRSLRDERKIYFKEVT